MIHVGDIITTLGGYHDLCVGGGGRKLIKALDLY